MIGKKFARLTVMNEAGKNKHGRKLWDCLCDCGKHSVVSGTRIRTGRTKSCGCLQPDTARTRATKHGQHKIREYNIWSSLKQRCENENDKSYSRYGGRGISVCERWKDSFENFLEDMGVSPSNNHSVDRVDNNGNYEPINCKWSTPFEQVTNRRLGSNNTSGTAGVYWREDYGKWSSTINFSRKSIFLGYFEDIEEAIKAREEAEMKYWGKSS